MIQNNIGRTDNLKQGISRFMKIDVDMNLALPVGVVAFSAESETKIYQEIIPVDSTASRDQIINTVNNIPNHGETCLQHGIWKGLEALR